MNKVRRRFSASLLALVCLCPAAVAMGQTDTGAASTLLPLEVVGQGARPLAMGSAFVAVKGDPMSALFNPAGQAYLGGVLASANYNGWIGGIDQDSLSVVVAGPALSAGLYGDLINYGSIDSTDSSGNATGTINPMDYSLGLCLAKALGNGLALGGTLRGTEQNIAGSGQTLGSADLGVLWSGKALPLTLGASYEGLPLQGDTPSTSALRVGGSVDLATGDQSGVLIALGGEGENNGATLLQLGVEGHLSGDFFLRAGYQASFQDNQTGGLSGLSAGLGAVIGPVTVDYAYLPYGRLGNSNQVSLSYLFDDWRRAPAKPVQAKAAPAMARPRPALVAARSAPAAGANARMALVEQPAPSGGSTVDMVFEVPASGEEARLLAATQQSPRDPATWNRLGRWYYDHGSRGPMVDAYRHYLRLDPQDTATAAWLQKVEAAR